MKFTTSIGLVACALLAGCSRDLTSEQSGLPRVVSLAPSLTEVVAAVGGGDTLVGRTTACNYPPELVQRVPAIGGFGRPSLESLMAVSPTVVIDVSLEDETIRHRLAELGIEHTQVACGNVAEILNAVRSVGRICGRTNEAAALAQRLETGLAESRRRSSAVTNRPSVYLEIWHDPAMTIGGPAYLNDVISLAGGRNIAEDMKQDYFQVSPEWVLEQDPDIIICAYMAPEQGVQALLKARPGWKQLKAIREDKVFHGLDNDILLRPGPRVLEAVEALRQCITRATEQ